MNAATVAQVQDEIAHRTGFTAHIAGEPLDEAESGAWIEGWLDAEELAQYGPLEWVRLDAEK